jgi:hypothetical protein
MLLNGGNNREVGKMDDIALKASVEEHMKGQNKFTRRMAITIALMADMTPKRLVLRCERLGLIKRGSWDWFEMNGGITKEHIAEVIADLNAAEMSR